MYFDHARCPSCGAAFDPEKIEAKSGSMACPRCGAELSLKSLFGVKEQFEDAEDGGALTIDDLVPESDLDQGARVPHQAARPAAPPPKAAQQPGPPKRIPGGIAVSPATKPPAQGGGAVPSAMDALRGNKKKG